MDPQDYQNYIRQMINHEDTLINHRYTWMLVTQALLFAALGVFWPEKALLMKVIICIIGLLTCVSIGHSLRLSHRACTNLKKHWDDNNNNPNRDFPPILGLKDKHIQWLLPWKLLPPTIGVAWLIILAAIIINHVR